MALWIIKQVKIAITTVKITLAEVATINQYPVAVQLIYLSNDPKILDCFTSFAMTESAKIFQDSSPMAQNDSLCISVAVQTDTLI